MRHPNWSLPPTVVVRLRFSRPLCVASAIYGRGRRKFFMLIAIASSLVFTALILLSTVGQVDLRTAGIGSRFGRFVPHSGQTQKEASLIGWPQLTPLTTVEWNEVLVSFRTIAALRIVSGNGLDIEVAHPRSFSRRANSNGLLVSSQLRNAISSHIPPDFVDKASLVMKQCRLVIIEAKDESRKDILLNELSKEYQTSPLSVGFQTMLDIVSACERLYPAPKRQADSDQIDNSQADDDVVHRPKISAKATQLDMSALFVAMKGIAPGTKWCGINDIASTYEDLGFFASIDKCCRAHDHCPLKVAGFSSSYGVFNMNPFTVSHCDCDKIFYDCLQDMKGSRLANSVGHIYFNTIGMKCAKPKMQKKCIRYYEEYGLSTKIKCIFGALGFNRTDCSKMTTRKCLEYVDDPDKSPETYVFVEQQKWAIDAA